jgi:regulatory protein
MGFFDAKSGAAKTALADKPRKQPKRITPEYLERAALYYLERYSSSEANLRRVLARKVYMSCRHHGDDPAQFAEVIDSVVARKIASGLIDDRRFAENRVASLKRRGTSQRMIGLKLSAKGVDRETIAQTSQAEPDDELAAALITARRKRLGPWRTRGARADWRQKDIAALMRAGFGSGIARVVIDGEARSGEDEGL